MFSRFPFYIPAANAAALVATRDRLSRHKQNLTSEVTHNLAFTTSSIGETESKVRLIFPDADDGKWCATALSTSVQSYAIASAPVTNDQTTLCFLASISPTTVAGSYSTTATLVTVAKF